LFAKPAKHIDQFCRRFNCIVKHAKRLAQDQVTFSRVSVADFLIILRDGDGLSGNIRRVNGKSGVSYPGSRKVNP
jgi:hypothetical protein